MCAFRFDTIARSTIGAGYFSPITHPYSICCSREAFHGSCLKTKEKRSAISTHTHICERSFLYLHKLCRIVDQFWQVALHVVTLGVEPAGKRDRAGALGRVEQPLERGRRHPHPVAGTHGPVCVQQILEEVLQSLLPAEPQSTARQEAVSPSSSTGVKERENMLYLLKFQKGATTCCIFYSCSTHVHIEHIENIPAERTRAVRSTDARHTANNQFDLRSVSDLCCAISSRTVGKSIQSRRYA